MHGRRAGCPSEAGRRGACNCKTVAERVAAHMRVVEWPLLDRAPVLVQREALRVRAVQVLEEGDDLPTETRRTELNLVVVVELLQPLHREGCRACRPSPLLAVLIGDQTIDVVVHERVPQLEGGDELVERVLLAGRHDDEQAIGVRRPHVEHIIAERPETRELTRTTVDAPQLVPGAHDREEPGHTRCARRGESTRAAPPTRSARRAFIASLFMAILGRLVECWPD